MGKPAMVGIGFVITLALAAAFTGLNKRWWGRRIVAKWDVHTGSDPGSPWTIYGPDFQKWTLGQLAEAWQNGEKGWYPKGQTPDIDTSTKFDV